VKKPVSEVSDRVLIAMAKQSVIPEDRKFDLVDLLEEMKLNLNRTERAAVYSGLMLSGYIRPFEVPSEMGRENLMRFRLTGLGLVRGIELRGDYSWKGRLRVLTERWAGVLVLLTLLVTSLAAYFAYLAIGK
jgi:hypothetical protein